MAEWLVALQGHPAELGELADLFRSPRLNIRNEGGHYYLRASEQFAGSAGAREVHEKATELLVLLSGIANLYTGAGEAVTPGGAVIWERDDGIRDVHIFQTPMRVRARMGTMAMDPTVVESWLALARQDDKVLDALRFFQEDTSWWSLRKAYEILEKDEFKQQSRVAQILSTPEEEIRRFKEWTSYYTMYTAAVDSTQTGSTLQHARPGAQVRRRYARKPNRNAQVHVAP